LNIHVFGASGSGVTTLGRALADRLGLPYFDADDFFWQPSDPPFTLKRPREERNASIRAALDAQPRGWILGGSVVSWGEETFPPFDLAIFLWLPSGIRMARLAAREIQRYGNFLTTDPYRRQLYDDFMAWAGDYDNPPAGFTGRSLAVHEQWIKGLACPVLQLRGDLSIDASLRLVMERVTQLP
jgi:adenylate kinase family enzyme